MKKFKSIISAALAGIMIASMIGCGQTEPAAPSAPAGGETAEAVKTVTEGKLTWATSADFPPYEFIENEQVVGIDAEVMAYIAEKLGVESAAENMDFSSVITAVSTGKTDVAASGITVNEDRKQSVDFSTPYVTTSQVVIVRFDSSIKEPSELAGKGIGVQLNTTGDEYVTTNYTDATVERYGKGFEAIEALKQKKIDAVVIDGDTAAKFIEADDDLVILDQSLTEEEYAFAVQKGNTALLNVINEAIAEMQENGKLDEIVAKYKVNDDEESAAESSETAEEATNAA